MEGNGLVPGEEVEPIKKVFCILDKQTACRQIGFMVSEESLTVQEKERISRTKPFGKGERVGRSGTQGPRVARAGMPVSFPVLLTNAHHHQLMKRKGLL